MAPTPPSSSERDFDRLLAGGDARDTMRQATSSGRAPSGRATPDAQARPRAAASTGRERTAASGGRRRRKGSKGSAGSSAPKRRPRVTVVGVLGETLMTFGVIMLLFVGWKYWLNDLIVGHQQNQASSSLSSELAAQQGATQVDAGGVVIGQAPAIDNTRFAILYVPAFGPEYMRPIAEGTGYSEVLDENIGHYTDTAMPGEVGNFAIAGHRLAYGAPMQKIHELKVGDPIIVETSAGWYTYIFRSGEYVQPTQVDVLDDVPRMPEAEGGDRIMTLMSCNPYWSTAERIIAYATFDSFTPRSAGAPAIITPTLELYGVQS